MSQQQVSTLEPSRARVARSVTSTHECPIVYSSHIAFLYLFKKIFPFLHIFIYLFTTSKKAFLINPHDLECNVCIARDKDKGVKEKKKASK